MYIYVYIHTLNNQWAQMASFDIFLWGYMASISALREGVENPRDNRRALRVCLILLSDNDLLYIPAAPGAGSDPTDYGRSPEYVALELALDLHPWLPIAPPATTILGSQYTVEELEAVLLE